MICHRGVPPCGGDGVEVFLVDGEGDFRLVELDAPGGVVRGDGRSNSVRWWCNYGSISGHCSLLLLVVVILLATPMSVTVMTSPGEWNLPFSPHPVRVPIGCMSDDVMDSVLALCSVWMVEKSLTPDVGLLKARSRRSTSYRRCRCQNVGFHWRRLGDVCFAAAVVTVEC